MIYVRVREEDGSASGEVVFSAIGIQSAAEELGITRTDVERHLNKATSFRNLTFSSFEHGKELVSYEGEYSVPYAAYDTDGNVISIPGYNHNVGYNEAGVIAVLKACGLNMSYHEYADYIKRTEDGMVEVKGRVFLTTTTAFNVPSTISVRPSFKVCVGHINRGTENEMNKCLDEERFGEKTDMCVSCQPLLKRIYSRVDPDTRELLTKPMFFVKAIIWGSLSITVLLTWSLL